MANTPEIRGEGRFRIAADGTWYHDGAPIARAELVRLFADVLERDPDGRFWLVTPVEKVAVEVEDAPFVAVALEARGAGPDTVLRLRTNVGRWVPLDRDHPLVVRAARGGPRPYVVLGGGLEALVARSVYYELAARTVAGSAGRAGLWSAGCFFPLEPEDTASCAD